MVEAAEVAIMAPRPMCTEEEEEEEEPVDVLPAAVDMAVKAAAVVLAFLSSIPSPSSFPAAALWGAGAGKAVMAVAVGRAKTAVWAGAEKAASAR